MEIRKQFKQAYTSNILNSNVISTKTEVKMLKILGKNKQKITKTLWLKKGININLDPTHTISS